MLKNWLLSGSDPPKQPTKSLYSKLPLPYHAGSGVGVHVVVADSQTYSVAPHAVGHSIPHGKLLQTVGTVPGQSHRELMVLTPRHNLAGHEVHTSPDQSA